jgi:hypothetical protein
MTVIDATKVLVGAPDQSTTGAVLDAPLKTALPTTAGAELDAAFTSSGYVSSDGVTLTLDRSTKDLTDWSAKTIRTLMESFTGTIKWSEMQMSYEALCHAFGSSNVTKTEATAEHGEQIKVVIQSELPPARSWVFKMKDGNARILIVVPNGQVTSVDEIDFTASSAVTLPLTLTCNADSDGPSIYLYTDDGVVTA